jgi:hypothetical protein
VTVYVDDLQERKTVRRMTASWSRLLADTEEELVAFGQRLGQLPAWLDGAGRADAHFLLVETARRRALRWGAVGITAAEAAAIVAARRAVPTASAVVESPVIVVVLDEEDAPPPEKPPQKWNPETARHSWLKIRPHWARCRHCDLQGENELVGGQWVRWWHWPDGIVTADVTVPKCPGPSE